MSERIEYRRDEPGVPSGCTDAAVEGTDAGRTKVGRADLDQVRAGVEARQAQMRDILDRIEARLKRQIVAAEGRLKAWRASEEAALRGGGAGAAEVLASGMVTACGAD